MHNNRKDALGKFDAKTNERVCLGYLSHSVAERVCRMMIKILDWLEMETLNPKGNLK